MASTVVRSRIFSIISRNNKPNRRFFCSNKERIISSQSTIPDQSAAAAAAEEAPAQASGIRENKAWKFFKYGIIGALTGATAFAGYASYAYSLDEVEEKTKTLRESVNYTASSDASNVEKYQGLLYSTVMTVPAKVVELYLDLRKLLEEHVKGFTEPASDKLLPDLHPAEQHVFTLVLDLNETIIYSDWKRDRGWRTFKRPGVDDFLQHLGRFYEIVVYSDQLSMYVDPVVERLDTNHFIRYRLSRSATKYQDGKHYRDLSKLNRDPGKILYVSGHAFENSLQPENCVPIKPFKIDETGDVPLDTALLDLIPFLECKLNFLSASTYYGPFDCPHGIETVIFLDFIAYKVLTFFLKYYSQNEGKNIITFAETEKTGYIL
ncbi:mitochondrial import inner membrane translocase subunit TIM50-like isoform X1 [Populus alba x Populus x berolinensis]|uniref:Mitochondrial import inner membrane translocase subunit TIM50 n=1 Tax=Populus alba x Populus x berolinensis TaxID=444605 RepID=A0AAD6M6M1_9ROSI|nr:mitochondrial import inner membrane translocase subunit TIM50-like isoform X1 [Populus alba]KAJ6979617.1 mitochondrial import inner membrane translocase subunit TIM50-like isoform X1 [Populus alba x Populus x berolinensis]